MSNPFVPAFAPAVIVTTLQGKFGGLQNEVQLLNGNVRLIDWYFVHLVGVLEQDDNERDDEWCERVWRLARTCAETRPEPPPPETNTAGKPRVALGGDL